tara:strand:- start:68 stop:532 length:465 start_codon:yes stop_codon:yes gene_type:complete
MNYVTSQAEQIPAMASASIDKVRDLEAHLLEVPQLELETNHVIHGGMYARTICLPAGYVLTGVLVKVSTIVIVSGHVRVYLGDNTHADINGYSVLPASAGRKQAFVAYSDTDITMMLPTKSTTISDVEAEFTDEIDSLLSHSQASTNTVRITGE